MLNATWYGQPYEYYFMKNNNLNQDQFNAFFDTTGATANNFGGYYKQALGEIAVQYGCQDKANCTGIELGSLQWGSVGVTSNPKSTWGDTYMPKSDTVAGWGNTAWTPWGEWTESVEFPQ